jgi:L-alanine-DL-glutamate epimerase-like enolase superfamily enzyme
MKISFQTFTVNKRFPLTISRGTTSQTTNIWLQITDEEIIGWGEASPFGVGNHRQSTEQMQETLQQIIPRLQKFSPWQHQEIEAVLEQMQVPSAVRAALDMALHDWLGKRVNLPLWQLWGLDKNAIVPTSVTIGINSPAGAKARTRDWLEFMDVQLFKVKLGSPAGITADQEMLLAVQAEAGGKDVFVDANGGWSLTDAISMCGWLADLGIKYVEQPLARGEEANLAELKIHSPLPIFVDESCFTSADITGLADYVNGVNIKLMKSGGITEAIRMVHTAKAHGLQVMFGCYSDSSLANTAALQLAPLADYLDLDSHLNLIDDPFSGAILEHGRLVPNNLPGLGVKYSASVA